MSHTVVSLCPFPLDEAKPQIIPDSFHIDASFNGEPSVLHLDKIWRIDYKLDNMTGQGVTERVPEDTELMARSIVNDFVKAQIIVPSEDVCPALFYVEGHLTPEEVKKQHSKKLEEYRIKHRNWCIALVKMADDDWQRFHTHRAVTDRQIDAAKFLGLEREWVIRPEEVTNIKCPACFSYVNAHAAICYNCKAVINAEKQKGLAFAS